MCNKEPDNLDASAVSSVQTRLSVTRQGGVSKADSRTLRFYRGAHAKWIFAPSIAYSAVAGTRVMENAR